MDHRMPGSNNNDAFANDGLFADSQNFTSNDSLFSNGSEFSSLDASWGVNASEFNSSANQSRGPAAGVPSWQQNANHLAASSIHQGYNGNSSPFGRSMNQSPASFNQNNFSSYATSQTYPYRQQQYDAGTNAQNFKLPHHAFTTAASGASTVAPQSLNHNQNFGLGSYGMGNSYGQGRPSVPQQQVRRADQNALVSQVPKGTGVGMFSIIDFDHLSRVTDSERMGIYANVGRDALEWDVSRSTLPAYVPRTSRNELRVLAGNNAAALAKIGKKSKAHGQRIKYENDSSSEDDSSSDDDSEYSSDDESDSPLPSKRPDNAKGGVEYDVIKALWRSKRKTIDGPTIRKGLADFWEVVKTIRDRWKADQTAVTDAEEKKKAGELPLLKSRVKDQREMAEAAFRAALKHGHRGIIELLAENVPLIFVCYQFLLDRFKDEDLNGGLSRSLLELMSSFTTLSKEKMEKTHLVKVLPRYQKKGDAKTQHYVRKILANAETASKEAAVKSEANKNDQPTAVTKLDPSAKKAAPEPVAGVKRPASASSSDGAAAKKVAGGSTKVNEGPSSTRLTGNGTIKKPATNTDATKQAASANAQSVTRKTVVTKPSGFFSSLQSATKKPGTSNAEKTAKPAVNKTTVSSNATTPAAKPAFSFAETMANLSKPKKEEKAVKSEEKARPEETPEEKAKRLRKEQRRKLHVSFKAGDELVQVRYFTHDPDEEIDHDSSQMRDVSDAGGEGRALKQHQDMMDLDDDDDEPMEAEQKLMDYRQPIPIDFTPVEKEERQRNYAPYGGGVLQPDSAERYKRDQYEKSTLMVFYSQASEIPANPKEPDEPYNGEQSGAFKLFGAPEEKYAARARQIVAQRSASQYPPTVQKQAPAPAPAFDISAYGVHRQQQQQSTPDIGAILASLTGAQQPAAAIHSQPFGQYQAPQHQQHQPVPPNPGQIDLSAILAQLQGQQQPQQFQQQHNFSAQGSHVANTQHPAYKTKTCKFWQVGACQKGEACSFLHE